MWAAELGHERVVEMVLEKGTEVNAQGGSMAMHYRRHQWEVTRNNINAIE
jgi:hypothetical protein